MAIAPQRLKRSTNGSAGNGAAGVAFTLDGAPLTARADETILQAADRHGIEIPRLCYKDGYRPDGNCRVCMVEIEGERVLAPSCCRLPTEGMKVSAESERAKKSQRMVTELLLTDMPEQGPSPYKRRSELDVWAGKLGVTQARYPQRHEPPPDLSHPAMSVNLDACIQCGRCVRACREEQVNDVIGYAWRGEHAKIVFDLDDPMGTSSCVACGECVQACPTGALMPANGVGLIEPDKQVDSACPYCGVGCLLTYNIKDNTILHVEGRDGPANASRLCVKGRFGFDYVHNPARLTKPMIRKAGVPKTAELLDPDAMWDVFREATWEEALELAGGKLRALRDEHGPQALAGFGSAKCSNEEAYLFQKLVRTGFGTNNVDHCTRLCHASSVAALLEDVGSGAVSNQVEDVALADVAIVIGSNPTVNHPVAATFMKNAAKNGTKFILLDPRRSDLARHATYFLQFHGDTDVALLNAMMNVIVSEGLANEAFIRERTENYAALVENVREYTPEKVAPITGIDAQTIREVARLYATAKAAMIFWGMGISQHVHGTDNARCLISLALLTGQIGRPGTGLHPLRGQNNVQGASDVGLIPMMFPDYQRVDDAGGAGEVRGAVGHGARSQAGADRHRDHGRGPRGRDPRHVHHGREPRHVRSQPRPRAPGDGRARAPRGAGHLLHRDRELRRRRPAGLGLPGEDRDVHQHRPPGAARAQGARPAGRGAPGPRRSSRRSRGAWASTGTTPARPRCSRRSAPRRPAWRASPGSAWSARARARTRSSTKAIRANR